MTDDPRDEAPVDDDVGETLNERPRDTADLDDVPASADRDLANEPNEPREPPE
jgi:hypothetical protein